MRHHAFRVPSRPQPESSQSRPPAGKFPARPGSARLGPARLGWALSCPAQPSPSVSSVASASASARKASSTPGSVGRAGWAGSSGRAPEGHVTALNWQRGTPRPLCFLCQRKLFIKRFGISIVRPEGKRKLGYCKAFPDLKSIPKDKLIAYLGYLS